MPENAGNERDGLAGLGQAFAMIIASEIGDKTFLIVSMYFILL